jgi:hypothetical protein
MFKLNENLSFNNEDQSILDSSDLITPRDPVKNKVVSKFFLNFFFFVFFVTII